MIQRRSAKDFRERRDQERTDGVAQYVGAQDEGEVGARCVEFAQEVWESGGEN